MRTRASRPQRPPARPLARKVAGQGALLMTGFAAAQTLSFVRNALIGHWLSPADFGVAATLTLMLQLLETLSDLGADRLIVQARDGNRARIMANAHLLLIARGVLTGLVLFAAAGPIARFFDVEGARTAFAALALAPLVKGFLHLDFRRDQRRLDNRSSMLVEVLPQAVALAVTWPLLHLTGDYSAVVWISIVQAAGAVMVSQIVARRRYRITADLPTLLRLVSFGWPILLSALPLIAVHSGDRMVIGKLFGMEALAAYSVAFMMTMVPGLLAAKVGHALMLPLLSAAQAHPNVFRLRYGVLTETTVLAAGLYLAAFVIAGGAVLPLAFGSHYQGLGHLVSMLSLMWAVRMVQAVPGMALIACGATRPLLVAGMLRASALAIALGAAMGGWGVLGVAAAGVVGELVSLFYVAWRTGVETPGPAAPFLARTVLLVPAGSAALAVAALFPAGASLAALAGAVLLVTACLLGAAIAVLPGLRGVLRSLHARGLQPTGDEAAA